MAVDIPSNMRTEEILTIATIVNNVVNTPILLIILCLGKGKPILSIFNWCNLVHFIMALGQIAMVVLGYSMPDGGLSDLMPIT